MRAAQKSAWENKLVKGFNTTDVPLEFCLLVAEVGEAIDAWRKNRRAMAEELADVAIFLFGLAEMTGIDCRTRSRQSSPSTRRGPTSKWTTASMCKLRPM